MNDAADTAESGPRQRLARPRDPRRARRLRRRAPAGRAGWPCSSRSARHAGGRLQHRRPALPRPAAARRGAGLGDRDRHVPAGPVAAARVRLRLPRGVRRHEALAQAGDVARQGHHLRRARGWSAVKIATGDGAQGRHRRHHGQDHATCPAVSSSSARSAWRSSATASRSSSAAGPRSSASTSTPRGSPGEDGSAYVMLGKVGYIAKGVAHQRHRRPLRLRRDHPRGQEVRRSRPGAADRARAALRAGHADGHRPRHRGVRPVLLRARQAPLALRSSRQRGGAEATASAVVTMWSRTCCAVTRLMRGTPGASSETSMATRPSWRVPSPLA